MNIRLIMSLLLLISAALVHCSDNSHIDNTSFDTATPTEVISDISKTIVIGFNHTVLIRDEDLLIKFEDITEGRCPIGVQCFWEGQATGEFLLIKPHEGRGIAKPSIRPSVRPDSDESQNLADDALGYRLFLVELNPYPRIDCPTDPSNYIAKLRVEKLPGAGGTQNLRLLTMTGSPTD